MPHGKKTPQLTDRQWQALIAEMCNADLRTVQSYRGDTGTAAQKALVGYLTDEDGKADVVLSMPR